MDEQEEEQLLDCLTMEIDTGPIDNLMPKTLPVILDGADGMIIEIDEASSLPPGYSFTATMDEAGNVPFGGQAAASDGPELEVGPDWRITTNPFASSRSRLDNDERRLTTTSDNQFITMFNTTITVGNVYRIVVMINRTDKCIYFGCMQADKVANMKYDSKMGAQAGGYCIKNGQDTCSVNGRDNGLAVDIARKMESGDRVICDYNLVEEGNCTLTLSRKRGGPDAQLEAW